MSYDLTVWEGPIPESDNEALSTYEQLRERHMSSDGLDELPEISPAIEAYVDALLERWPDIGTEGGESSPWSDGPLIFNASGPMIYFGMQHSRAEEASAYAASVARSHGLVCFDPQTGQLRGVGIIPFAERRKYEKDQSEKAKRNRRVFRFAVLPAMIALRAFWSSRH
jgi:hypothetical protein